MDTFWRWLWLAGGLPASRVASEGLTIQFGARKLQTQQQWLGTVAVECLLSCDVSFCTGVEGKCNQNIMPGCHPWMCLHRQKNTLYSTARRIDSYTCIKQFCGGTLPHAGGVFECYSSGQIESPVLWYSTGLLAACCLLPLSLRMNSARLQADWQHKQSGGPLCSLINTW